MGQLVAEVLAVLIGREVAVLLAPIGDGIDHALDELGDAGFALRRAQFAVEILAGDDVGGGLRPIHGDFDVALLEDDGALVVADGGGAGLPLDVVVGGFAGLLASGEVAGEGDPRAVELRLFCFQHFHFGTQVYGDLTHGGFPPNIVAHP